MTTGPAPQGLLPPATGSPGTQPWWGAGRPLLSAHLFLQVRPAVPNPSGIKPRGACLVDWGIRFSFRHSLTATFLTEPQCMSTKEHFSKLTHYRNANGNATRTSQVNGLELLQLPHLRALCSAQHRPQDTCRPGARAQGQDGTGLQATSFQGRQERHEGRGGVSISHFC